MFRWIACALLMLPPAGALAQPRGGMGLAGTPIVVDLAKAPLGSWADYVTTVGEVTVKTRWAFIARDRDTHTLETIIDGGPMGPSRKTVMRMVLAANPKDPARKIKQMVMQVGEQDPIEMPVDPKAAQQIGQPDPKQMVGKETVTVAAGSFETDHYRNEANGGTSELWLSPAISPVGLVKLRMVPAEGTKNAVGKPLGPVTVELVARGSGAKPSITRPARPAGSAPAH